MYLLAKIGADTAENERNFAEILPKIGNYPTGLHRYARSVATETGADDDPAEGGLEERVRPGFPTADFSKLAKMSSPRGRIFYSLFFIHSFLKFKIIVSIRA